MTELKYGGSDVKIMYGSQEIGGTTKLEPGTILYVTEGNHETGFEDLHLSNTTKNWSNINGINARVSDYSLSVTYAEFDITGDDFKNLDIEKTYTVSSTSDLTVSRSIVDGEYRLNASINNDHSRFTIKAI